MVIVNVQEHSLSRVKVICNHFVYVLGYGKVSGTDVANSVETSVESSLWKLFIGALKTALLLLFNVMCVNTGRYKAETVDKLHVYNSFCFY